MWVGRRCVFMRKKSTRNKGRGVLSRRQGRKVGWVVRGRRRKDVRVKERGG